MPLKIGCEGRDLLDLLGYNSPQNLNDQRKMILTEYLDSLNKWLTGHFPESPTDSKVFGFLGPLTGPKKLSSKT